jgi:hypothetical protein
MASRVYLTGRPFPWAGGLRLNVGLIVLCTATRRWLDPQFASLPATAFGVSLMDTAMQAALDQNSAALRDAYDFCKVNIHDEAEARAIEATVAYLWGVWLASPNSIGQALTVIAQTLK